MLVSVLKMGYHLKNIPSRLLKIEKVLYAPEKDFFSQRRRALSAISGDSRCNPLLQIRFHLRCKQDALIHMCVRVDETGSYRHA